MPDKRGLFISLEGSDGVGKSTHIQFIQDYILSKGLKVELVREPGGTKLGEQLRQILLHQEKLNNITELLLLFASRQELIDKVIEPALSRGICIIADRFIDSSRVYQGIARGLGVEKVECLINMLDKLTIPDLTYLFDTPVSQSIARVHAKEQPDRIEQESVEFFTQVHQGYLNLAKSDPKRIKIISTANPKEITRQNLSRHLDELFINKFKSLS